MILESHQHNDPSPYLNPSDHPNERERDLKDCDKCGELFEGEGDICQDCEEEIQTLMAGHEIRRGL